MTEHKWKVEEVDGGHMGVGEFWRCENCGAAGGPVGFKKDEAPPTFPPFYSNGSGLQLTNDCEISKQLMAAYDAGLARGKLLNPSREKLIRSIKKEALKFVKSWSPSE